MRRTIARVLLAALTTTACKSGSAPAPEPVELTTLEAVAPEADPAAPGDVEAGEAAPDEGPREHLAMALEEGTLGKQDHSSGFDRSTTYGGLGRAQALEQARTSDIVGPGRYGTISTGHGAGHGTGHGTGMGYGRGVGAGSSRGGS
ncbi:MAG: hypothetical protein M3680_37165, partial [Myxococcota bacterium]|nr:hypothetical protein [Myxococcota bacterium]